MLRPHSEATPARPTTLPVRTMNWHKWLIRGLVGLLVAAIAVVALLYALWTNPVAVRQLVQEKLGVRFIDVAVQVSSARLRLLGGILVHELRLARSNALDRRDFLYVPEGVLYHDKECLFEGKVGIRRIEFKRPQIRVVRERDGRFNLSGVLGPVDLTERIPTVVLRHGTLVFEDRASPSSPLLEIRDLQLTMINDPLPTLQFEGSGQIDVLGPVRFKASVPRATLAARIEIELPAIPVNSDLLGRVANVCPDLGLHLAKLTGVGSVQVKLQLPEDPSKPITHDVTVQLNQGHCTHPMLPRALDQMQLTARLVNGVVPEATMTAASGRAKASLRIANLRLPNSRPDPDKWMELLRELDLSIEHAEIDDEVLSRLPADLQFLKPDFSPAGPLSCRYRYRRPDKGPVVKEWTFVLEGMTGSFVNFSHPVTSVRGTVWLDVSRSPQRNIRLDLTGLAGGQPVALRGTIQGEKNTSETILDITGKDILLDDRIHKALPERLQRVTAQFLPTLSRKHGLAAYPLGRADVHAAIRRAHGETKLAKTFTITFKNCSVLYDKFPYPLDEVSGVLEIHPDHWQARGFRGVRAGGELLIDGRSFELPGKGILSSGQSGQPTPPERIHVRIQGKGLLLDREFENALVPSSGNERLELQAAWKRLRLTGRLSFAAEVIDHPGQPQDIDVSVDVHGCAMKPTFFDYALEELSGSVRYVHGKLYLRDMKARHGAARLAMAAGLIQLAADSGFTAWLEGLTGQQVIPDADLLVAVPDPVRHILESLRMKSPMDVATNLTLRSEGAARPMQVWWKGAVGLRQASLRAGVELTEVTGQMYCEGYHDGRRLRGVSGRLGFDRFNVIGQPFTKVLARFDVEPTSPDVLRFRDVKAELFGGTLAGEAYLETSPRLKYDVLLEALGVRLELFGKHNLGEAASKAQLQGPAGARVHLTGDGSDLLTLKGNGRIEVPKGKLGQLPVLLDLVKAFGLRVPDRTAFEQAQMVFAIEGPQVQVQQLGLYGNAISLRGQGTVDIDGSNLNLDFSATPGRMTQILPESIDNVSQLISGQFLRIKMRGKLGKGGELKFEQHLIPGVVEPIKRVIGGG